MVMWKFSKFEHYIDKIDFLSVLNLIYSTNCGWQMLIFLFTKIRWHTLWY